MRRNEIKASCEDGAASKKACKNQSFFISEFVLFIFLADFHPRGGGTCQTFDRDARPIFLGLKFGQILLFWVGNFLAIFLGFAKFPLFLGSDKFPAIFLGGLQVFVSHT